MRKFLRLWLVLIPRGTFSWERVLELLLGLAEAGVSLVLGHCSRSGLRLLTVLAIQPIVADADHAAA